MVPGGARADHGPGPTGTTRREFLASAAAATLLTTTGRFADASSGGPRVALVVGNDRYPTAPLANAAHDARGVAGLLTRAGFDVDLRIDARRAELIAAAERLAESARRPGTSFAFFYFAGHGVQLDWRNYLLPVDARVDSADDLPGQGFELSALLSGLGRAKGRTYVVILDACRDDPFGSGFRTGQPGLSQFDAPPGGLVAFSTAPGRVAADAAGPSGRGGLYTGYLLRELDVPGVRIEDALKRVRLAVRLASRGAQVPWESTSLEADVVLVPAARRATAAEIEAEFERELAAWNRVKVSDDVRDWIGYLREWPGGKFTEIAQGRLARLAARDELARAAAERAPAPPAGAEQPRALVIGAGAALPALLAASPNPNSAGTYPLARAYAIGDEVVYRRTDPVYGGPESLLRLQVTRVEEDRDRVEFNEGQLVIDLMGNMLVSEGERFEPRSQVVPAVIQVGYAWTTRFSRLRDGARIDGYYEFRVVARERLEFAFGSSEAFRIEGIGYDSTGTRRRIRHWIVPGLNFSLRSDVEVVDGRSLRVRHAERRDLVSCRQERWLPA